jgi:hypothetical protein
LRIDTRASERASEKKKLNCHPKLSQGFFISFFPKIHKERERECERYVCTKKHKQKEIFHS